jgi:hypothetical protein
MARIARALPSLNQHHFPDTFFDAPNVSLLGKSAASFVQV